MRVVRIESLPGDPLDASAAFHAEWLPSLRSPDDDLLVVFPPAEYTHRLWRLAAIQQLAREAAPHRANAIAAQGDAGVTAALALIDNCQGITGQYLVLDEPWVLSQSA